MLKLGGDIITIENLPTRMQIIEKPIRTNKYTKIVEIGIRKGDILSVHDYSIEHIECADVVKAVNEIFGNNFNLELDI